MKKKILFIEEDETIIRPIQLALEKAGFKIILAGDGGIGIEKMRREKPDLVLLDILLPTMNGFEALKEIKADPDLKGTPVFILSNLGRQDEIDKGIKLGAEDYVVKTNLSLEKLVEKIEKRFAFF